MRNRAYDSGILPIHSIPVPVVSVGNITAGGSGKTPVVEYLASVFTAAGKRVCVVSRGYGRSTTGTYTVSSGNGPEVDSTAGGDEPVQIAEHCPGTFVVVDEDRVRGCHFAVERFNPDIIVLDDAYQHRRCGRNADILVYDASTPVSRQTMLPHGRLREPIANCKRAHFILLTRCDSEEAASDAMQALNQYSDAPVSTTRFIPSALRDGSGTEWPINRAQGKNVFAFCGIGSPESFKSTVQSLGCTVAGFRAFGDHHAYTEADIREVAEQFAASNAEALLTTEKDRMRLTKMLSSFRDIPFYSVKMKMEFLSGENAFLRGIQALLDRQE